MWPSLLISINELLISINELLISINELLISINELLISINELLISIKMASLILSQRMLPVDANELVHYTCNRVRVDNYHAKKSI